MKNKLLNKPAHGQKRNIQYLLILASSLNDRLFA